jgi:hypothetical protein
MIVDCTYFKPQQIMKSVTISGAVDKSIHTKSHRVVLTTLCVFQIRARSNSE